MSILDAAFEWVRTRIPAAGTYSMPLPMEDPLEKKPKRSITREEAESFLVRCEYCGVHQFLEEGYCSKCGGDLPEPIVPEVIVKEVEVQSPTPTIYESPTLFGGFTSESFGMISTDMLTQSDRREIPEYWKSPP